MVGTCRHRLVIGVVRYVALGRSPCLSNGWNPASPAGSLAADGLPGSRVCRDHRAAARACDIRACVVGHCQLACRNSLVVDPLDACLRWSINGRRRTCSDRVGGSPRALHDRSPWLCGDQGHATRRRAFRPTRHHVSTGYRGSLDLGGMVACQVVYWLSLGESWATRI